MNELRDSPFGGSLTVAAIRQARLVLAASAVCDAIHKITDSHAEFEAHIANLKVLAGLMPDVSDRMLCMSEILRLRSCQLAAECRPPPPFSDAGCDLRPKAPVIPLESPTAVLSSMSVGAVGISSR